MDFKEIASRLVEKLYSMKGSNQANEIEDLLENQLRAAYMDGMAFGRSKEKNDAKTI